jgi:hypothetical protein
MVTIAPLKLTFDESPTRIVSKTDLSENRIMVIEPSSAETASEKVRTMLASIATPVARVAGEVDERVGVAACAMPLRPSVVIALSVVMAAMDLANVFMGSP